MKIHPDKTSLRAPQVHKHMASIVTGQLNTKYDEWKSRSAYDCRPRDA